MNAIEIAEADAFKQRGVGRRLPEEVRAAIDGEMTDEQLDFLKAVEKFKTQHSLRFLRHTDYLLIFKALGYKRCGIESLADCQPSKLV